MQTKPEENKQLSNPRSIIGELTEMQYNTMASSGIKFEQKVPQSIASNQEAPVDDWSEQSYRVLIHDISGWIGRGSPRDAYDSDRLIDKISLLARICNSSPFKMGKIKPKDIFDIFFDFKHIETFRMLKSICSQKDYSGELDINDIDGSAVERVNAFLNSPKGIMAIRSEIIRVLSLSVSDQEKVSMLQSMPCPLLRSMVLTCDNDAISSLVRYWRQLMDAFSGNFIALASNIDTSKHACDLAREVKDQDKSDSPHYLCALEALELWLMDMGCRLLEVTREHTPEPHCRKSARIAAAYLILCNFSENPTLKFMIGDIGLGYCFLLVSTVTGNHHHINLQSLQNSCHLHALALKSTVLKYENLRRSAADITLNMEMIGTVDAEYFQSMMEAISSSAILLEDEMVIALESMANIEETLLSPNDGPAPGFEFDELEKARSSLESVGRATRGLVQAINSKYVSAVEIKENGISDAVENVKKTIHDLEKAANQIVEKFDKVYSLSAAMDSATIWERGNLGLEISKITSDIKYDLQNLLTPLVSQLSARSDDLTAKIETLPIRQPSPSRKDPSVSEEQEASDVDGTVNADAYKALQEAHQSATEELSELRAVSETLIAEEDRLKEENSLLKQENESLKQSLAFSNQELDKRVSEHTGAIAQVFFDLIDDMSVTNVLKAIETAFPDRIRILPDIYRQENSWNGDTVPVRELLNRLMILCTDGVDILRKEGSKFYDIKDIVPGGVSAQESETVRKNAKLRKYRTFKDGDKEVVIYSHIDLGYSHRIYFDFCAETQKIRIAYVGRHLPTARYS